MKKTYVKWSPQNKDAVAIRAHLLVTGGHKESWVQAIFQAQKEVLSPEKQRALHSLYSTVKDFKARAARLEKRKVDKAETDEEAVVPREEVSSAPQQDIVAGLFGTRVQDFAKALATQFEEALVAQLNAATNRALELVDASFKKRLKEAQAACTTIQVNLPKVLIAGLKGPQVTEIVREYGDLLDLRFYSVEDNVQMLRASVKHVNYVCLMVDFINHKHQDAVRDHVGLIMVNGTVSALKDSLLQLACK